MPRQKKQPDSALGGAFWWVASTPRQQPSRVTVLHTSDDEPAVAEATEVDPLKAYTVPEDRAFAMLRTAPSEAVEFVPEHEENVSFEPPKPVAL